MIKRVWGIILVMLLTAGLHAAEFNKMVTGEPELIQKGEAKAYCPICGMNINHNYKTSHGVYLKDGTTKQYCSLRCLVVDFPSIESQISRIVVTDVKSETLIDATTAFYVVGSTVAGTMSKLSKLAFAHEEDAKAFAAENGGTLMRFEAAFANAKASLSDDVEEFVKKKQQGMYPMGEKIYISACQKENIHLHDFRTISALKAHIKKTAVCGELADKELQAVSLYIWEVLDAHKEPHAHKTTMHVEKSEKCPVCGMFAYKYPKWAARMNYVENGKAISHVFDGVKDMLKFYHNPSKWGNYTKQNDESLTLLVSDYYTQAVLDGKKAFYVVGSDVMGPMGREFIPFSSLKSAQTFMKDHKGKQVIEFSHITENLVYAQDQ